MVGYGEEDSHFVAELTYNYGIKSYKKGNDFKVFISHSYSLIFIESIIGLKLTIFYSLVYIYTFK